MNSNQLPTGEYEFITPELAAEYLKKNMANRNPNRHRVDSYVRQIINEEWVVTHQGIAFDWNDELIDGQHRLLAIIKAGVGLWLLVVRGLSPDVRYVIDTGRPRSASDALSVSGYTHATKRAGMAKAVILYEEGAFRKSGQSFFRDVSSAEVLAWCAEQPEHEEWLVEAQRIYRGGFPTQSPAALAAALFICSRISPEFAHAMADRMRNQTLHGPGDPLFTLATRLRSAKAKREVIPTPGLLHLYFRVWNALRRGERLSQLKIGSTGNSGPIGMAEPK